MKLFPIAAAALAMLAGLAPVAPATAAPAPQRHVEERTVVTHRTVVRNDRRYRPRYRTKRVCRIERHRGERTRICRTVRYRR